MPYYTCKPHSIYLDNFKFILASGKHLWKEIFRNVFQITHVSIPDRIFPVTQNTKFKYLKPMNDKSYWIMLLKGLKILTSITSEYVWLYLDNNETLFGNAVIANDPVKGILF